VANNLNEQVRDELIEQDINNQRALGGVQNAVDRRLVELGRDLRRLVTDADLGTGTPAARRRKLDRVDELSKPIIATAFQEINALTRNTLGRMAVVDVAAFENAIAAAFGELPSG
jgi:hypothetical protein